MMNGPTTELSSKRPTVEQLERIRQLSMLVYGREGDRSTSGLAFKKHGMPQSREEASELLILLDRMRRGRTVDDEETAPGGPDIHPKEESDMETRECEICKVEKPLHEFRKFGRGRKRDCRTCEGLETSSTTTEEQTGTGGGVDSAPADPLLPTPDPTPPLSPGNGLTDPKLSQLRALEEWGGFEDLGTAAEVWEKVVELGGNADV